MEIFDKNLEIWLVRHGESEVNLLDGTRFSGSNLWSELTPTGIQQAIERGRKWSGQHFTQWICSPAIRAQQSCRYCYEGMFDSPILKNQLFHEKSWALYEIAPAFVEQSQGLAEGLPKKDFEYRSSTNRTGGTRVLSTDDSDKAWWTAQLFQKSTNQMVAGAESQEQVFNRSLHFLELKLEQVIKNEEPDIRIAIFTHETVIKCLCSKLLYLPLTFNDIRIDHTAVIKLMFNKGWKLNGVEGETNICYS